MSDDNSVSENAIQCIDDGEQLALQCDSSLMCNNPEPFSDQLVNVTDVSTTLNSSFISSDNVEALDHSDSGDDSRLSLRKRGSSSDDDYTGGDLRCHKRRRFRKHADAIAQSKLMVDARKQKNRNSGYSV